MMKTLPRVLFLTVTLVSRATSVDTSLIGYSFESTRSVWAPKYCPTSNIYTTLAERAGCASGDQTDIPVSCEGNLLIRTNDNIESCAYLACDTSGSYCFSPSDWECRTWTVFESQGSDSSALLLWCKPTTEGNPTFYRQNPDEKTPTATPGPSPTRVSATATSTTNDTPEPSTESEGSQAWIAGAVIGPVAGCAILAGLAWWLLRRKKANAQNVAGPSVPGHQSIAEIGPGHHSKGPSELSAPQTSARVELPS